LTDIEEFLELRSLPNYINEALLDGKQTMESKTEAFNTKLDTEKEAFVK
jgi:hypothetical protein